MLQNGKALKYLLSIFLLVLFFHTQATAPLTNHVSKVLIQLSGTVTDSLTGQPLAGTSIYLSEARLGAIADAQGRYQLRDVPAGHHRSDLRRP